MYSSQGMDEWQPSWVQGTVNHPEHWETFSWVLCSPALPMSSALACGQSELHHRCHLYNLCRSQGSCLVCQVYNLQLHSCLYRMHKSFASRSLHAGLLCSCTVRYIGVYLYAYIYITQVVFAVLYRPATLRIFQVCLKNNLWLYCSMVVFHRFSTICRIPTYFYTHSHVWQISSKTLICLPLATILENSYWQ